MKWLFWYYQKNKTNNKNLNYGRWSILLWTSTRVKSWRSKSEKNAVNYIIAIIAAFAATGIIYGVLYLFGIY